MKGACRRARRHIAARLGGGGLAPRVALHLERCESCRRVYRRYAELLGAMRRDVDDAVSARRPGWEVIFAAHAMHAARIAPAHLPAVVPRLRAALPRRAAWERSPSRGRHRLSVLPCVAAALLVAALGGVYFGTHVLPATEARSYVHRSTRMLVDAIFDSSFYPDGRNGSGTTLADDSGWFDASPQAIDEGL